MSEKGRKNLENAANEDVLQWQRKKSIILLVKSKGNPSVIHFLMQYHPLSYNLPWPTGAKLSGDPGADRWINYHVNLCRGLRWPHLYISRRPAPSAVTARHRRPRSASPPAGWRHHRHQRGAGSHELSTPHELDSAHRDREPS